MVSGLHDALRKAPSEAVLLDNYARVCIIISEIINEVIFPPQAPALGAESLRVPPGSAHTSVPIQHKGMQVSGLVMPKPCLQKVLRLVRVDMAGCPISSWAHSWCSLYVFFKAWSCDPADTLSFFVILLESGVTSML